MPLVDIHKGAMKKFEEAEALDTNSDNESTDSLRPEVPNCSLSITIES